MQHMFSAATSTPIEASWPCGIIDSKPVKYICKEGCMNIAR